MRDTTLRNYKFDNAKFFLILCVVLLHFISPHRGLLTQKFVFTQNMYICLQLLAMPCFTLISGAFSHARITDSSMVKMLRILIVPYIIFELIYSYLARDYNTKLLIIEPFYILWYLLSLAIWRTLLPYFLQLKFPLITAIAFAVFIGFCGKIGDVFALGITFLYFPLFILGYKLQRFKDKEANKGCKLAALAIICFIIYFIVQLSPNNVKQFEPIYPYYSIYHSTVLKSVFLRTFWMMISVLFSVSFLILVSAKKSVVSEWGQRSLYPYLFHAFILLMMIDFGVYQNNNGIYIAALILGAMLTTILFSTRLAHRLFNFLVEPDLKWLFRLKAEEP
ncbi:acyltransferase family protein [uncultured Legionella sp.]|uniref:acyltransferase family protein n=1 Tax=uncultured Legionella sp. TaxID=210934 RepID=UPI00260D915D|nr:acyltransferase family protein [uncultured Legionella sp.]